MTPEEEKIISLGHDALIELLAHAGSMPKECPCLNAYMQYTDSIGYTDLLIERITKKGLV